MPPKLRFTGAPGRASKYTYHYYDGCAPKGSDPLSATGGSILSVLSRALNSPELDTIEARGVRLPEVVLCYKQLGDGTPAAKKRATKKNARFERPENGVVAEGQQRVPPKVQDPEGTEGLEQKCPEEGADSDEDIDWEQVFEASSSGEDMVDG